MRPPCPVSCIGESTTAPCIFEALAAIYDQNIVIHRLAAAHGARIIRVTMAERSSSPRRMRVLQERRSLMREHATARRAAMRMGWALSSLRDWNDYRRRRAAFKRETQGMEVKRIEEPL